MEKIITRIFLVLIGITTWVALFHDPNLWSNVAGVAGLFAVIRLVFFGLKIPRI